MAAITLSDCQTSFPVSVFQNHSPAIADDGAREGLVGDEGLLHKFPEAVLAIVARPVDRGSLVLGEFRVVLFEEIHGWFREERVKETDAS